MESLLHLWGVQIHAEGCGVGAGWVHPDLIPGYRHPEQVLGESQESPYHSSTWCYPTGAAALCPLLPTGSTAGQVEDAHSPVTRVPGLTCRQENLIGIRMKELPRSCVMRQSPSYLQSEQARGQADSSGGTRAQAPPWGSPQQQPDTVYLSQRDPLPSPSCPSASQDPTRCKSKQARAWRPVFPGATLTSYSQGHRHRMGHRGCRC